MNLTELTKQTALELGFTLVGVTDVAPVHASCADHLRSWLSRNLHADLKYMERNLDKRLNPAQLFPHAKSIIVVALNYKPPEVTPPLCGFGKIASYACYEDYHDFIKARLNMLAAHLKRIAAVDFDFKICVDSAPVLEKVLAQRAGLGFIGKNHILTNPVFGPQLLIGEMITSLPLEPDQPAADSCLECTRCISACPTGALRDDGFFDVAKCISYLTIAHNGAIELPIAAKFDNCLFGCDACLTACPYQKTSPLCDNKDFHFFPNRTAVDLHQFLNMTEEDFETAFNKSVLLRTGLVSLKRNAQICLRNSNMSGGSSAGLPKAP